MSLLSTIKTDNNIKETKDTLGTGGFGIVDSDVYLATVKHAYLQQSSKGSIGVALELGLENGITYKETLWITNAKGENFYEREGEKHFLIGYTLANDIALFTTQKEITDQKEEDKIAKIYNIEQQKEIPTEVPTLVDLLNQQIKVAILKELRPKQKKDDSGNYVDTEEMKESNSIQKIFHPNSNKTTNECRAEVDKAEFMDKWLETWKGEVKETKPKLTTSSKPATTAKRKNMFT